MLPVEQDNYEAFPTLSKVLLVNSTREFSRNFYVIGNGSKEY